MSGKKPLGLKDVVVFGKHKGKTVKQILLDESDAGWLLWIRLEKHKQGETMFDAEVNGLLNKVISSDKGRWGKFRVKESAAPGTIPIAGITTPAPDRSEAYDEKWGAF